MRLFNVFAVQCSMLLNVIEHKNVIEDRYSWCKRQLKLVSFIQDYSLTEVMHTKCIHEKVHNVYIAVYIMYTMIYTKCIHFTFSALRIMYTFCMPILKPFLYT